MPQRLISADSHVKMTHEQVKAHLASKHHASYDAAAARYEASMAHATGAANRAGAQLVASNAVFRRRGYWDPVARLEDMDADGVDTEVLYSEVSAFRYLSDVKGGGLPRDWLTLLVPGLAGWRGCPDAEEVPSGVQA